MKTCRISRLNSKLSRILRNEKNIFFWHLTKFYHHNLFKADFLCIYYLIFHQHTPKALQKHNTYNTDYWHFHPFSHRRPFLHQPRTFPPESDNHVFFIILNNFIDYSKLTNVIVIIKSILFNIKIKSLVMAEEIKEEG